MNNMYLPVAVNVILLLAQIINIGAQDQEWINEWKLRLEKHKNWCAATTYCRNGTDLFPIQLAPVNGYISNTPVHLLTPEEGCGVSEVGNARIVGGEMAKKGAYPWMALLGHRKGIDRISFFCGGSLITSRHVLTAGHCFLNGIEVTPQSLYVRLGEHDLSTPNDGPVQDVEVIRIDVPPGHNPHILHNDLAILTLARVVGFTSRVKPICLSMRNEFYDRSLTNTHPFVAGWGGLLEDGFSSNVLVDVQVPFIDTATCTGIYKKIYPNHVFNDAIICAGSLAGGQSTCQGDSGGPLMMPILVNNKFTMFQTGVVSYALGCARVMAPTVYTRVEYFLNWIQQIIKQV